MKSVPLNPLQMNEMQVKKQFTFAWHFLFCGTVLYGLFQNDCDDKNIYNKQKPTNTHKAKCIEVALKSRSNQILKIFEL